MSPVTNQLSNGSNRSFSNKINRPYPIHSLPNSPSQLSAADDQSGYSHHVFYKEKAACGWGVRIAGPGRFVAFKDVERCVNFLESKGARGIGFPDGNTVKFLEPTSTYLEWWPNHADAITSGKYQVLQVYVHPEEGLIRITPELHAVGLSVSDLHIMEFDQSSVPLGERRETFTFVQCLIVRPDNVSGLSPDIESLMGLKNGSPLSDYDFWRLTQLVYLRVNLNSKHKDRVHLMDISRDLSFPNLFRAETIGSVIPEINQIKASAIGIQTRASTRTEASQIGNHSGRRAENGENTACELNMMDIEKHPKVKALLGFDPDLSSLSDTWIGSAHFLFQVLFGRHVFEAYANCYTLVDPKTNKPHEISQVSYPSSKHAGPFISTQIGHLESPDERGLYVHRDQEGLRPSSGFVSSTDLSSFYASTRPSGVQGTPAAIMPGVLYRADSTLGRLVPVEFPEDLTVKANRILSSLSDIPPNLVVCDQYSQEDRNYILNANGVNQDHDELYNDLKNHGDVPSESMGRLRYTGMMEKLFSYEAVRGTAPSKKTTSLTNPDHNVVFTGRRLHPFDGSQFDLSSYQNVEKLDSFIITPSQMAHIESGHTVTIQAFMPHSSTGRNMLNQADTVARLVLDAFNQGVSNIVIEDCNPSRLRESVPIPPLLLFGRIRKLCPNIGDLHLCYKSHKIMDPSELAVALAFGCKSIYVPMYYDSSFCTLAQSERIRAGVTFAIRQIAGGAGVADIKSYIGKMAIGLSRPSREIASFLGFPLTDIYDGGLTANDIALKSSLRFGRTAFEGAPLGLNAYSTDDPSTKPVRNPKLAHAIRQGDFQTVNKTRVGLEGLITVNGKIGTIKSVVIVGLGPSAMTALTWLYEKRNEHYFHITMIERDVPGGLATKALFPTHSDRIRGFGVQFSHALDYFIGLNQVTVLGGITVSEDDIANLAEKHWVIDARGVTQNKMPTFEGAELATPPSYVYHYSGGPFTQKTEGYRQLGKGNSNHYLVIEGGSDVAVDMMLAATLSSDQFDGTWAVGVKDRLRPVAVIDLIRRNEPHTMPAKLGDLKELASKGVDLVYFFDKSIYPSLEEVEGQHSVKLANGTVVSGTALEKLKFALHHWGGQTLNDIPPNFRRGKTVFFAFGAQAKKLEGDGDANKNVIVHIQNFGRDFELTAAGYIPCFGYDTTGLSAKSIRNVTIVGQRTGKAGDIPTVSADTKRILSEHNLDEIPSIDSDSLPTFPNPSYGAKQVIQFFRSGLSKPKASSEALIQALYSVNSDGDTKVVDSKRVQNDLLRYVQANQLVSKSGVVQVHIIRTGKTYDLTEAQVAKHRNNILEALYAEYLYKEKTTTGLSEACAFGGTCLTCFAFDLSKLQHPARTGSTLSEYPALTDLLCVKPFKSGDVFLIAENDAVPETVS